MADIRTFVQGGLRIELCDIEAAVPLERIDRQVADPERGEILEKVRASVRHGNYPARTRRSLSPLKYAAT